MRSHQARPLEDFLEAIDQEIRLLRRLYHLALRQQGYLIRGDARRLESVAGRIGASVEKAREAARTREERLETIAGVRGRSADELTLQDLVPNADTQMKERVERRLRSLAETGAKLFRQNHQNHMMTRFSLDLLQEEMELFLGTEPAPEGYDAEGARKADPRSTVVNGRA